MQSFWGPKKPKSLVLHMLCVRKCLSLRKSFSWATLHRGHLSACNAGGGSQASSDAFKERSRICPQPQRTHPPTPGGRVTQVTHDCMGEGSPSRLPPHAQLIEYDPEAHLLPLVYEFGAQPLDYGQGGAVAYDFAGVQAALATSLLAGVAHWREPFKELG